MRIGISEFIENELKGLQAKIRDQGLIEISNIREDERLLLLMYVNEWFKPGNVDVIVSLLDSCRQIVVDRDILKLYYIYANALIVLATKGNFAAGKSRIEEYINSNRSNSYALHSIISTITHSRIRSRRPIEKHLSPLVTIDTIITHLPFDDPWILEECVRHLYNAEFFSFSEGGFCLFFETVQISYNKLTQIIDCALSCEHTGIYRSPMVGLVRFLREKKVDFTGFANIFDNLPENSDPKIRECLRELHFVMNSDEEADQILSRLKNWIEQRGINEGMRNICMESIDECLTSAGPSPLQLSLIAELMENRLSRLNCLISARDYLYIMACCGFMWMLSARFDGKAPLSE